MNRRERKALAYAKRKEMRTNMADTDTNSTPNTQDAFMQLLEPIVAGLILGQKKLVIESRVHGTGEMNHTIKVVDSHDT